MDQKIPILGSGLKGLVGSKFVKDFSDKYSFDSLDVSDPDQPVDITKPEQIKKAFADSSAKIMLHFAAYTNVTGAWEQTDDKQGLAYQVNVVGTQNIVAACQEFGIHLVHISTAYVFDGKNESLYAEQDTPNPIEWYGQTKLWAEEVVQKSQIPWTILRIDQPFRSDLFFKVDVVHQIINGLLNNSLAPQFTDHYFGPTFIDDFAKVLDWVIRTKTTGLFHASSGEKWSDYEFAKLIKQTLELSGHIDQGKLIEYLKTINRPYQKNTALDTSKLKALLDFKLNTIEQAVASLKKRE